MAVKQPTDLVLKTDYEDRKVRLPRLNLPKFDGDVTRFREFLDQFEVSFHQQVDLSNATKLAYFRGCLITIEYGVALDALRGLSAANQGYELAVQRLKERFDRPLQPEYRALSSGGATVLSLCHRIPVLKILTGEWKHLQFLDPIFDDSSDEVHVMIGIDYYYRFGVDYLRSSESTPSAQDSCCVQRCSGAESRGLAPSLLGDRKDRSLFQKRVRCTRSGEDEELLYDGNRYSVRLLWRKNEWNLPDNFAVAKAVSRHLNDGWPESHHDGACIIPFCRTTSRMVGLKGTEAMKHRIVFDGSVRFEGTSLNEQLDPGPKMQAYLLGILLRFRRYREDRDACRFLWRKDEPGGFLATYRLTRVCFGLAFSPYLAIEKRDCFRTVVDEIKAGIYVDDLVVSCHTIAEAKDFVRRSSELLGSGGFHLAKWASNAPEALVDRPTEEILWNRHSRLGKTIGVSWNPQEDERLIDELTYDKRFELRS
ncbi:hypothetical protein T12_1272 [Trichinella patagoniensis]|uniref:Reverse transcriptase domain-containing protein n=1 Tax=Trichinella patagoniensis TaxID=990121 RepID=A0A0V0ZGK8_9BILA|nr:hypothetical protein T12_1272 [Trichinella patagoniensis]